MSQTKFRPYHAPAGGWGSAYSVANILLRERVSPAGIGLLLKQNKPIDGFACVSCAWAKPHPSRPLSFCENGAKATAWETTSLRCGPEFFARHSVSELLNWSDYDLEQQGRLTHPLRYDAASDHYRPVSWDEAFAEIGAELKAMADPDQVVFYMSGRAALETAYMYGLLARLYGTNNLPDSSNMCHESTSVGLPRSIGVPVGTVRLEDFGQTDCILSFGQNVGTNSPRMLHPLQEASRRGVPIIVFNPLRERGWERFTNPQEPGQMLTGAATRIGSAYHQVRAGGDIALVQGLCKALLELDARSPGQVLDQDFLQAHTTGFAEFAASLRATPWQEIECESGLARADIEAAAAVYARARSTIVVYGMGITQHRHAVDCVRMLCNLLLMRGNIGRPGGGICPVRGHSNVQGQRTVGITEKPELAPLDRLAGQYGFEPPRTKGLDTVGTVEGVIDGSVRGFIGLGGNFIRAAPETVRLEEAWRRLRLSVQVATKLNRSHLVCGEVSLLLPCLGRLERDTQASGDQIVTTEDSTACIHASFGDHEPAAPTLRSEPAIVAGIAMATLEPDPRVPWQDWVDDYARVRDAIEATYPEQFRDFNTRLGTPGGFPRPNPARERRWQTPSGKAEFVVPHTLDASGLGAREGRLRLMTVRSNDQFNTTIYGYHDRFRGIDGTRRVVLMGDDDMRRLGLAEGEQVELVADYDDGVERAVGGLRVTRASLPAGCIAGYYPECNPLLASSHHAVDAHVPAGKSIPVRVRRGSHAPVPAGPAPE